jgi:hypothetical protein
MQSVPITTNVVSSNPAHGEVYLVQHYVIKFTACQWFSPGTTVSSTSKTDRHDITEILLKVALNIITQFYKTKNCYFYQIHCTDHLQQVKDYVSD